jgi:SLA1 homology domain 1, SHD1
MIEECSMRVFVAGLISILAVSWALGAEKTQQGKFEPGEKVKVERAGETFEGTVVELLATGFVKVKFRTKFDDEKEELFSSRKVKSLAARPAADDPKPPPAKEKSTDQPAAEKPGSGASELRKWADKSGKFNVTARFVGLKDGVVSLEQKDGKALKIPLDKLSDADREFAKKLDEEKNPFETTDESPFESSAEDGPDKPAAKPEKARPKFKVGERVKTRWGAGHGLWRASKIKRINAKEEKYLIGYDGFPANFDEWVTADRLLRPDDPEPSIHSKLANGFVVDPFGQDDTDPKRPLSKADISRAVRLTLLRPKNEQFVPDPAPEMKLQTLSLPLQRTDLFPESRAVRLAGELAYASASEANTMRGNLGLLECLDLTEGNSRGRWELPPGMELAAVTPNGKFVALRFNSIHANAKGRLDVYEISKDELTYTVGFRPYKDSDQHWKDVNLATYVDDTHLMTIGGWTPDETIALWKMPECKALWYAKVASGTRPALSPGRKQIAIALENDLLVIDALSGDSLLKIPNPYGAGTISFSPDGRTLALTAGAVVVLFDLAKAEMVAAIGTSSFGKTTAWADNAHVLAGDLLISVSKKLPLWSYKSSGVRWDEWRELAGGVLWRLDGPPFPRENSFLKGTVLPSEEALEAEEKLDESKLMIQPGSKISLDVNVGAESGKITEGLTQQLAKYGVAVAPAQSVRLVATMMPGKPETVDYEVQEHGPGAIHRRFFAPKETVTKTVTPMIHKVEILGPDNRVAWSITSSTGVPIHMFANAGESIDDAIRRYTQPNPGWFATVKIPTHVPKPEFAAGLGSTSLD